MMPGFCASVTTPWPTIWISASASWLERTVLFEVMSSGRITPLRVMTCGLVVDDHRAAALDDHVAVVEYLDHAGGNLPGHALAVRSILPLPCGPPCSARLRRKSSSAIWLGVLQLPSNPFTSGLKVRRGNRVEHRRELADGGDAGGLLLGLRVRGQRGRRLLHDHDRHDVVDRTGAMVHVEHPGARAPSRYSDCAPAPTGTASDASTTSAVTASRSLLIGPPRAAKRHPDHARGLDLAERLALRCGIHDPQRVAPPRVGQREALGGDAKSRALHHQRHDVAPLDGEAPPHQRRASGSRPPGWAARPRSPRLPAWRTGPWPGSRSTSADRPANRRGRAPPWHRAGEPRRAPAADGRRESSGASSGSSARPPSPSPPRPSRPASGGSAGTWATISTDPDGHAQVRGPAERGDGIGLLRRGSELEPLLELPSSPPRRSPPPSPSGRRA